METPNGTLVLNGQKYSIVDIGQTSEPNIWEVAIATTEPFNLPAEVSVKSSYFNLSLIHIS